MKHMWLLFCAETGVKFLFYSLEAAVQEIEANQDLAWTLESIAIYDRFPIKAEGSNVILNQETGKVDKKFVRTAPVPLNRAGDTE
jgi:hypothetical protein